MIDVHCMLLSVCMLAYCNCTCIYVRKEDMFEYVFVIKRFSVNFPLGGLCVCVCVCVLYSKVV